ncbi:class I SAM-dependent methyltransferase [Mycolicibacter minnesotensis]
MSAQDRARWDRRYADRGVPAPEAVGPAAVFEAFAELFPTSGHALDLACGPGTGAVWLARRGLRVVGVDVSEVAIEQARGLAMLSGVGHRCRFDLVDLDDGLPDGPAAHVIYCTRFRDSRLDAPMAARLAPGGLLAVSALGQSGGTAGRFRAAPGELRTAFACLEVLADGEADGLTWLLARRPERADGRD